MIQDNPQHNLPAADRDGMRKRMECGHIYVGPLMKQCPKCNEEKLVAARSDVGDCLG